MDTPVIPDALSNMELSPSDVELAENLSHALTVLNGSASPQIILDIMSGLQSFPKDIALQVSKESTWRLDRNAIPRDFVELARQFHGVSKADLLAQGRAAFSELFIRVISPYNLICSNWRVVYAVKHEFATLRNLFWDEEPRHVLQQRFAESYAHVDFTDEAKVPKEYFLRDYEDYSERTPDGKHRINVLGNYQQCEQLLKQLKLDDIYQLPPLPQDKVMS